MPQLDVSTFLSQYFWLVLLLGIAYYKAYNNIALSEIIKLRRLSNSK